MSELALTAQERQQLVSILRELDGNTDCEQRRHPRRKSRISLTIRVLRGGPTNRSSRATLVNVSARGVGLLVHKTFVAGDKFLLPLRFDDGGGWLVLCEVRNCTLLAPKSSKVGARFLDRIEDPDGDAEPPMDWLL